MARFGVAAHVEVTEGTEGTGSHRETKERSHA
jgi:hypothetical protein